MNESPLSRASCYRRCTSAIKNLKQECGRMLASPPAMPSLSSLPCIILPLLLILVPSARCLSPQAPSSLISAFVAPLAVHPLQLARTLQPPRPSAFLPSNAHSILPLLFQPALLLFRHPAPLPRSMQATCIPTNCRLPSSCSSSKPVRQNFFQHSKIVTVYAGLAILRARIEDATVAAHELEMRLADSCAACSAAAGALTRDARCSALSSCSCAGRSCGPYHRGAFFQHHSHWQGVYCSLRLRWRPVCRRKIHSEGIC